MSKGYSIQVKIGGKSYGVISDAKPEYMSMIASRVDNIISQIMAKNSSLSYERASVMAALKFCDEAYEAKENCPKEEKSTLDNDNIRRQIMEYSREIQRLTDQNKYLKSELERIKNK